ncbi:alpha-L-Rha alpha-1,3-L-rhamnosyltransferase [Marivirga lumbricoides]|uniref:Alpha-L-Rha alpha-1,3-L-rhamnosyltransferase n=1 Tax=Marivirga lumbricoides TaxID=1046115 RepID=A0A2T4DSM6_9BACT|nr:alpha-L-Rha alpha-1,3-L-rhamnosyltransferase [Marivirga lumbricoides]
MRKRKISVCLASYNGENYIEEQINSILCQLDNGDELIISDDSSTDNTVEIIKNLEDNRIVLLVDQKFKSPIFNFENALNYCNGDFIFLSDQDDKWRENKVEVTLKYLNDYDLVVSDCQIINENDEIINESFFALNGSKEGLLKNIVKNSYLGCCMAFKRRVLEKALPFPDLLPMHDWWLGLIGEIYYKTFFASEKLIYYRRHQNNASSTSDKSSNNIFKKLNFRIKMIWELIRTIYKK